MKRTRFTEEQVIGVLKEAEAGAKTADLARRHGVSLPRSPVLYLHPTETVRSTSSPSNAVLVVANRATEKEGNDARNKEKD